MASLVAGKDYKLDSLYAKLIDGRAQSEFPKDFFGAVEWHDGVPYMPACRWKKKSVCEPMWEWTIFLTHSLQVVPDYMNRMASFHPNYYMMRFCSRQNTLLDLEVDSIYELSSNSYDPIFINKETGQVDTKAGSTVEPSQTFRWVSSAPTAKKENLDGVEKKIVPTQLTLKSHEEFVSVYGAVKRGELQLPNPMASENAIVLG